MDGKVLHDEVGGRGKKCIICCEGDAKYCCPRCKCKTCSLKCVKKHKLDFDCDGIRCKTAFVSLGQFTDCHLLNDYRFLEDVGRAASNASRDSSNRRKFPKNKEKRLRVVARRHGVRVLFLPVGMSKKKENTSYVNYRTDCIYWKIKLHFTESNEEYCEENVSETTKIGDLIRKYVDKDLTDPVNKLKLLKYVESDQSNIQVILKPSRNTSRRNNEDASISFESTISDALIGKTILEYPTFQVMLSATPVATSENAE